MNVYSLPIEAIDHKVRKYRVIVGYGIVSKRKFLSPDHRECHPITVGVCSTYKYFHPLVYI